MEVSACCDIRFRGYSVQLVQAVIAWNRAAHRVAHTIIALLHAIGPHTMSLPGESQPRMLGAC